MKSTLEVLRDAREFMSDEANCAPKGTFDVDERYCLMAVFTRRPWIASWGLRDSAIDAVQRCVGSLIGFYDDSTTTHADVLSALDRAIANEEARAQGFAVEPVTDPVLA